jgi:hypothetical protein
VAHAGAQFFSLDAVGHPLHKSVAGMRLHIHRVEWFHIK